MVEVVGEKVCVIVYDICYCLCEFVEFCVGIMIVNGFKVYFFDGYCSILELLFFVCYKNCCCGIMVMVSYNLLSDNVVKIYGFSGG